MSNSMELKFKASLSNELLARQALIAFISPINPSMEEIGEFKTIISLVLATVSREFLALK